MLKSDSTLRLLLAFALISLLPSSLQPAQAQGIQTDARLGHTAMPAFGRETGITHFEFMPYILDEDESIFYGDLRGFITNEGNVGGNIGTGYRFLEPNDILMIGVNGNYGFDQSLEEFYQQMSFGIEGSTRFGRLTSNFYVPVGEDEKTLESRTGNVRMQGNQIVLDTIDTIGVAMKGVDVNMGVYLPGEFATERNIEATVSWYHFEGANVDNIDGVRMQVEGDIIPYLQAQFGISNDDTFGTNVTLGMTFRFGNNDVPDNRLDRQFRRFNDSNYNVIVSQRAQVGTAIPLINPLTDNAYVVQNVQNTGATVLSALATEDGSTGNPFDTIAEAQGAGGDIIYLHEGSSFNESIVLQDGQMLFAEGSGFSIDTSNFGVVTMEGDSSAAPVTIHSDMNSPAITLADNSSIAGLTINPAAGSTSGDLIVANGINNFRVENAILNDAAENGLVIDASTNGYFNNVTINNSQGDGVQILNHDGYVRLDNVTVENAGGNGVQITGGHGETAFGGDLTLINNQGSGLLVEDYELITTVDDQGTTDTSDDVEQDIYGYVAIENLILEGATGQKGVELVDNEGLIDIFNMDVKTTDGTGIEARNSDFVRIRDGHVSSVNAPAIDVEDSAVDIRPESISADGGMYGIRMVSTTGTVLAKGGTEEDSGGTIKNTDTAIFVQDSGSVGFQMGNFVDNDQVAVIQNADVMDIISSKFTGTTNTIVQAENVKLFALTNNLFEDNSMTMGTAVNYTVDETGGYVARIVRNTVVDSPKHFFNAQTLPGGESASLDFSFRENSIDLSQAMGIAAKMDWTGPVNANIVQNLVTGDAANQKAFQFWTGDSAELGTFTFSQNVLGFTEQNATAIEVLSQSTLDLAIFNNAIEFRGKDSVGVRASASRTSSLILSSNLIDDYAGGATGILFPTIHDGSSITLDGNEINLQRFSTFVDRGIILSNVTGTDDPLVTLNSNLSNAINGATTTLFVPANATNGRLIINGQVFE
ncbi:inverse autotransporter beta domain-containing protein [Rubinisphaera sp.]|uniref:inverse autotransporter beta domain-containing protein n=1 Tax=Rubinisphaera sp. TaxID=2024857 RepID=UPI000C10D8FD|nr:inverse autotransporter beta domain-containing protein [Rubinisphaera sp.]MBV11434.1 hypothetical protein [Rubinisphaera sp.]|tara:strand:- start:5012 stop:7975 length:2964 start_codon:yes stop_codon:yes gene_type:complete